MRRGGIDHAHIRVFDQRHGLPSRLVRQAKDDDVHFAVKLELGLKILADLVGEAGKLDPFDAGELVADLQARRPPRRR